MRRRFAYACAGGLVSAGAPVGLLAARLAHHASGPRSVSVRAAVRELGADRPGFIYVATTTALAFALFGYVLGRQADQLTELSETDSLTGLWNARGLFRRLDTELARSRRYREPFALLLLDLDGLKNINDRYGHDAGDEALRGLAEAIRSELREADVPARWGGDEFALLAPNTSSVAAIALAERIRSLIPQRSVQYPLTGSVGVAAIDPAAGGEFVDAAVLMRTADAAMYEAKRRGRNRVVMALPGVRYVEPADGPPRPSGS